MARLNTSDILDPYLLHAIPPETLEEYLGISETTTWIA
jgi:hypothetical protein